MAEVSNGIPAVDLSPGELLWEKYARKVNADNGTCHLELDKISDRNSYGGKFGEECGVRLPSFEANQSFPRVTRPRRFFGSRKVHHFAQPLLLSRLNMEHISGDGLHSMSFTSAVSPLARNSMGEQKSCSPCRQGNTSFLHSFGPLPSHNFPVFNPAKAVFTIDSKSTEILVVNDAACNLLEYPTSELVGLHLWDLMGRTKTQTALSEEHLDGDMAHLVSFCGKVVEMVAKDGRIIPVSMWVTHLQSEETGGSNRCLAVAEPVERAVAQIIIDKQGFITSADKCTAALFQYEQKELVGKNLKTLIPSFKLPSDFISLDERKQKATGRTVNGENFPLSLLLSEFDSTEGVIKYSIIIWVFASMSGLVVLGSDGTIEGCNHHFVQMMFGYPRPEIIGKKITTIIPDFCPYKNDAREGDFLLASLPSSSTICHDGSKGNALERTAVGNTNSKVIGMKGRQFLASVDDIVDSMDKLNMAYFSMSRNEVQPETPKHQRRQRSMLMYDRSRNILDGLKESFTDPLKEVKDENEQTCEGESESVGTIQMDHSEDVLVTSTPAVNNKARAKSKKSCSNGDTFSEEENDDTPSASRILSLNQADNGNTITSCVSYTDGEYHGYGLHKDGALLNVKYRVQSAVLTESKRLVYCVWIAKNTSPDAEVTAVVGSWDYDETEMRNWRDLTLYNSDEVTSAASTPKKEPFMNRKTDSGNDHSLLKNVLTRNANAQVASAFKDADSGKDESEDDYATNGYRMEEGDYEKCYACLYQIGKGAFGCVCMGYRKSDSLLVITKFIRKERVFEESWVVDPKMGKRVPLEISLLTTLKHPSIVSVLEVCENPSYFQLIMEKHGAGMDLFEFIDRNPDLDEPLISYIFRQVASAVEYLHSLQILHRDIKDENIILNEAFQAKLIDFGSATFSSPGRLFSSFYGTVEYCSPEVLAGNKYAGPELEMWSMGVTLYVLCFGENPFFDVEETLKAELNPPYTVSEGLQALLESMLEKDPIKRCTVEQLVNHPWLNQHVDISQYVFSDVVQCKPHEKNPPTHYDEGEDVGSSYFSGFDMSEGEDDAKANDNEHYVAAANGEDGLDANLRQSCNVSSLVTSFSRVSPTFTSTSLTSSSSTSSSSSSSSSSDSLDSSASYHSASHSRGSSTSTMTSTHSVISGCGHESKDNELCTPLRVGFGVDEMDSEIELPAEMRRNRGVFGYDTFAVEDFNNYDELDDSFYDEQDSFA